MVPSCKRSLTARLPAVPCWFPTRPAGNERSLAISKRSLPLRFGNDSFLPHLAAAKATGLPCVVLKLPGIARDVDRPEDLRELASASGERRSQKLYAAGTLAAESGLAWPEVEQDAVHRAIWNRQNRPDGELRIVPIASAGRFVPGDSLSASVGGSTKSGLALSGWRHPGGEAQMFRSGGRAGPRSNEVRPSTASRV